MRGQFKNKKILLIVFIVLLIGGISYLLWSIFYRKSEAVVCTQEAKLCSDGSYVVRTGSNCEFSACPGE